jgi:hypothetical protein
MGMLLEKQKSNVLYCGGEAKTYRSEERKQPKDRGF